MSRHADRVRDAVACDGSASAITASWRRCLNIYRLDPDIAETPRPCLAALERSRERDRELLAVARPTLDELFALIAGTDCTVLLADRDGVLIDYRTKRARDAWGRTLDDWRGTCFAEESLGTTCIGTCLVEQRGVIIRGDQHFLTRYTNRVGMSAPLFGPDGALIGCLCLSLDADAHDARLDNFLFITVANFGRRIETSLFAQAHPSSRLVLASSINPRLDALLAVDHDDRVIGATRGARRQLELGEKKLARAPNMKEIFPISTPADGDELADVERRAIIRALARCGGNHSAAAKAIGISRSTLYRKLKSYETPPPSTLAAPLKPRSSA